jgi:hypothetical protein
MTRRNLGVGLITTGLAALAVGKVESLRDTWINAALTGLSLILLVVGLYYLWKAKAQGGNAGA